MAALAEWYNSHSHTDLYHWKQLHLAKGKSSKFQDSHSYTACTPSCSCRSLKVPRLTSLYCMHSQLQCQFASVHKMQPVLVKEFQLSNYIFILLPATNFVLCGKTDGSAHDSWFKISIQNCVPRNIAVCWEVENNVSSDHCDIPVSMWSLVCVL